MIRDFLQSLAGTRSAVAAGLDTLDVLREAVAAKKAEIEGLERAPRPVSEVMDDVRVWADRTATNAIDRMNVHHLLEPGRAQEGLTLPFLLGRAGDGAPMPDATAAVEVLLGALLSVSRDAFLSIVEGQLTDLTTGRQTLTESERSKKVARATRELLDAELAEEACVRALEQAGVVVARRPDLDPRAALAADASLPV